MTAKVPLVLFPLSACPPELQLPATQAEIEEASILMQVPAKDVRFETVLIMPERDGDHNYIQEAKDYWDFFHSRSLDEKLKHVTPMKTSLTDYTNRLGFGSVENGPQKAIEEFVKSMKEMGRPRWVVRVMFLTTDVPVPDHLRKSDALIHFEHCVP